MTDATCQCGCAQTWLVMPGDLSGSISPACQERLRRERLAASREKSRAIKEELRRVRRG